MTSIWIAERSSADGSLICTVYPSMKTALRTYHPVPSLQTDEISRKDMQDAPRIKGILKASLLDWEVKQQPTCLQDIARKLVSGVCDRCECH